MSFPRYPAYKDSGVRWLGNYPSHWETKPLWTLFRREKRQGFEDEELLSVYRDHGVVPKRSRSDNFNKPSDDLGTYQLVEPGDLAINKMKAWQGSVAISGHRGIVSPAYHVYASRHQDNNTYLHYLMRSERYITGYLSLSKGIRVNQWDLQPEYHSRMPLLIPPLEEQLLISEFLDHHTAKIDALITQQQQLIELLQEKRRAFISHAVTKGLNPDAPMKDSGVEWLGDVPNSWEFGPLKYFWNVVDCKHVTVPFLDEGFPVVSIMEVRGFDLDLSQVQRTSANYFHLLTEGGRQPSRGDVIYCRNTANTGMSAYVNTDQPIAIGQDVVLIKSQAQNGRFLNYILHSGAMAAQLDTLLVGSTFKRINVAQIRSLSVTCPPKEEQDAIVAFLDTCSATYSALCAEASRAISLLNERRTALISAAVTGQIDVRGLAPLEASP